MNTRGDERFHAAMASPTRRSVLAAVVASAEGVDAATIAASLQLHVTTVRFHLDQLETVQLVARRAAGEKRRGRPRVLYTSVAGVRDTDRAEPVSESPHTVATMSAAALARSQSQLIDVLARALTVQSARDGDGGRGAAVVAGRAWGRAFVTDRLPEEARTTALLRTLGDLGFDPEPRGSHVALHGCPFRDAARKHPQVVCAAHLGLVREIMNDNDDAVHLVPMVQPTMCVITLPQQLDVKAG